MRQWWVGVVIWVFGVVLTFAVQPALAPDIEGRAQAARAAQASVVVKSSQDGEGRCGGTFVAAGAVLTAYHCLGNLLNGSSSAAVLVETADGRSSRATLGQYWVGWDLAILVVDLPGRVAQLAPDVAVGEAVWLVGAPAGENFMVSKGVVSQVRVGAFVNEPKTVLIGTDQQQILAVDALTWQGNSGGGLFNQDGQLVGVAVRILVVSWASSKTPGEPLFRQATYGYAVGVDTIRKALGR